jgi:hypothetical protein
MPNFVPPVLSFVPRLDARLQSRAVGPLARLLVGGAVVAALTGGSWAHAATITAASCSPAAVQTALNQAAAGDTVRIPAGTCSWTSAVSWNAPANVTVLGAGNLSVQGGGDATVFVDNLGGGQPLLSISTNGSGTFSFGGITIRGGSGSVKEGGMIAFRGTGSRTRIHNIHIDKSAYSPQNTGKFMVIGGMVRGVIDNSLFNAGNEIAWIHFVNGEGAGHGDTTWTQPTGFGTADFMFVEDSRLIANRSGSMPPRGTFSDCHTGGKFVIRYSSTFNGNVGQTHPTGHAGDDRGCRGYELYGITATADHAGREPTFAFSYNNSGPAMNWGNSVDNVYKNIIYFNVCMSGTSCGYSPPYGGWGLCNGSGPWHGNQQPNGYPCVDQPGRGQGDQLTGTFPNKTNAAMGRAAWPRQQLEPVYEWLTTGRTATGWGGSWVNNNAPSHVVQNRDFFVHYGNTSCNAGASTCAGGVGVGTLAERPAGCALNTAWWATDQGGDWNKQNGTSNDGALYRCTSANSWQLYYTPYSYPHPLRTGQAPAPTPTALPAPSGLLVR